MLRLPAAVQAALGALLVLGALTQAVRLLARLDVLVWDLSGSRPASLEADTRACLRALDRPLLLTYFVSQRARLPSAYQQLEDQVRALLAALQKAAPEQVRCRVLYPEASGDAGAAYAAARGAAAFHVPRVLHDEHDQQPVWSTLVLELEGAGSACIHSVRPEHLPHLEALVRAQVAQLQAPATPVFAVAAPPGHERLVAMLGAHGDVHTLDLDGGAPLATEADVLFWVQPRRVTPAQLGQLRDLVAAGRSVVLAGSTHDVQAVRGAGMGLYAAVLQEDGWAELLRPFGLTPVPELLLDQSVGPPPGQAAAGGGAGLPFLLRCLPAHCDLRGFAAPAAGGLSFAAAAALEVDAARVRAAGFRAQPLATTTAASRVLPLPAEPFAPQELAGGTAVGQRNLAVLLAPTEPLWGKVLVLGSSALLRDGWLDHPGYGHGAFLRNVVQTLANRNQLAIARAPRRPLRSLRAAGGRARACWRLLAVGLGPGLWLGAGAMLLVRRGDVATLAVGRTAALLALGGLGAVAAAAALAAVSPHLGSLDLTADRLNSASPWLRRELAGHGPGLRVELVVSPRRRLPLELKAVEPRLRSLLRGTGATLRVVHPEPLAGEIRAVGSAAGLAPVTVQQVRHDTVLARQVWCGMRLARAGTQALVPRIDAAAAAHLEFLLGAALRRLDGQAAPAVALVASPPRLSPAEALEDYQRKGLVPPSGTDVYGRLHARLADYGYQVRRVRPDSARFGDPAELVVWLQPRRDSSPAAAELARHLHAGGRALVALQHFRIQQRQYRGTGFETVYWPQPQFQDLDPLLGAYGLTQVREVLMDRTRSHLMLETQINRAAVREYDRQQVALPFLLRVVGSGLSPRHPVTRQLGDLLFCWGNRFALDPAALRRAGLEADTLAATSPQAWAYAWSGGWLPPEAFAPATRLGGPQPLIVSLRGRFPAVTRRPGADGGWEWVADPAAPGERPGELLLIGCAAMFEDGLLEEPGFAHQQLLLNAVAWLACGPELAAVQARQQAPRGFAHVSPGARIGWRLAGVAGGPLFFALLGLGMLGAQGRRGP